MAEVIQIFKRNNRIACYIEKLANGTYNACVGKPSDNTVISFNYDTLSEAIARTENYLQLSDLRRITG